MWCLWGGGGGGWLSRSGHWSTTFPGHFREYNPEKTNIALVFWVRLNRTGYKPMTQISGSLYRNVTRKRVNMLATLFSGSHWPGWSAAPTDADSGSIWPGKSTNQWLGFPGHCIEMWPGKGSICYRLFSPGHTDPDGVRPQRMRIPGQSDPERVQTNDSDFRVTV